MKPVVLYDSNKEDLIDRYLCEIDKNPIICINPIEGTSYLGISYTKYNVHRSFFRGFVEEYKDYMQEFVQSNQSSPESYEYVETTLTWLLNKFKNALKQFDNSSLRQEWRMKWLMSRSYDEETDEEIEEEKEKEPEETGAEVNIDDITLIEINNNDEPYHFFLRVSATQKYYIKDLIDFITDLLLPIKVTNKAMTPYKKAAGKIESETVYVFRLTKPATEKAVTILNLLYTSLKKHGYINCSSREFKNLFVDYGHIRPLKSPSPIIWNCEYYNHLAYLVKCLIKNKIITPTKVPSNYKIALHLFNDRNENNFYRPKKERYDGNLNPKDQAKIDSIIEKSLKD
jgi:hypothetical protein